ncbi:DUF3566 domain-containing protein [Candidatus Mycobacterium wuenschmannii]|uniref:DUF3566 domain-containing protein n=1 Tax=Candidatus Mycobacterium wuenschmannii TaxID=3027808 RepID=A0ABY8VUN6_9MYCO|nr:DUF3566 domain-containing protein [Candidatus Mycobacterium wuenschmannii]WIM86661.1 DUF3566 domain-containing protein [Candidatus Mycobacterium wuenschmannii]
MTSPNEPGHAGPGDNPNGTGGGTAATPRKRPPARPAPGQQRQPARGGAAPNAEARLNRFISGTAAPGAPKAPSHEAEPVPAPTQNESRETDAYASELPDLSGPIPRGTQRKSVPDHADGPMTAPVRSEGRIQVSSRTPGPVRASMQIRRIDPWSTLKVSAVLSVALFFVWMIAVAFLYLVLGGMGVWSKLNSNVGDLLNNTSGSAELVSSGTIFGGAILIGLVNIVLLTAAATIGAFIYNLTTDLIGGVEVTLADRD